MIYFDASIELIQCHYNRILYAIAIIFLNLPDAGHSYFDSRG